MEKLELKHVLLYLPYNLKCQYFGIVDVVEYHKFNGDPFAKLPEESNGGFGFKIRELNEIKIYKKYWKAYIGTHHAYSKCFINGYDFKLCLLPLSEIYNIPEIMDEFSEWHLDAFETAFFGVIKAENRFDFVSYSIMELMFKHHIDIFGLIDSGLAIDKRTI